MLEDAKEMALSAVKRGWVAMVSTPGQAMASVATLGVGYANQNPSAILGDICMIAGGGVSITLIALNLLRFIKELMEIVKGGKKKKKRKKS